LLLLASVVDWEESTELGVDGAVVIIGSGLDEAEHW